MAGERGFWTRPLPLWVRLVLLGLLILCAGPIGIIVAVVWAVVALVRLSRRVDKLSDGR